MKLLIGDDSMTQRVMLQAIVSRWGFEAVLAEDGQQVWDRLCAPGAPRLVLLDWEMPGLDGIEVCRRVREQNDDDPPYILLLTSRRETADIVAGLEAGANDYISKPFDETELRARLRVGKRMLDMQQELIGTRESLEFQANHDALTGLLNRGAVMRAMSEEMERARDSGKALQAGLIDIDYFKKINDEHGHLAGDEVLRELARRLENTLGPRDLIGRYGGEEFLVLIDSEADDAETLFERMRGVIADHPFEHERVAIRVTISGGFVTCSPRDALGASELLATADKALYAAKAGGRNRIVRHAPPGQAKSQAGPSQLSAQTGTD